MREKSTLNKAFLLSLLATALFASGCGGSGSGDSVSSSGGAGSNGSSARPTQADFDRSCDNAVYPSAEWTQCEAENFAMISQATAEGAQPAFQAAAAAQSTRAVQSYAERLANDPSYLPVVLPALNTLLGGLSAPQSLADALMEVVDQTITNPTGAAQLPLNTPVLTECALQAGPCVGDPFRYPEVDGPDGRPFFESEARVQAVTFYDRGCARLAGTVWQPRNVDHRLPGVVFETGSVGAPETLYRWLPQLLVRHGYAVLTFEARGQGRSDFATPQGGQGTNVNPKVFWEGFVDAIDFFRSSPDNPYPNELACAGTYPTETDAFNPQHAARDNERLGAIGHSLSAIGVTAVQGYGATGADPWPGQVDATNPVDVAVAMDGLTEPGTARPGGSFGPVDEALPQVTDPLARAVAGRDFPNIGPRVPTMGQSSDYGLFPAPYAMPPDPEFRKRAFKVWQQADVPVYDFTIRGSSHLEWSQVPPLPATSFCPDPASNQCDGGFGLPMIEHYTLAWLDRWLKNPGEEGYATADARLLDDGGPQGAVKMSFRFRSARDFPDRSGRRHRCEDIRAGCNQ